MLTAGEHYELTGSKVTRCTRGAVLVTTEDLASYWIPRSACVEGDDLEIGSADIRVLAWWAEREGIV